MLKSKFKNDQSTHYSFASIVKLGATRIVITFMCLVGLVISSASVSAEETPTEAPWNIGGKLLATGGVTQIEGAAGGGLTPWAVIGGYGTAEQLGANAFFTDVNLRDYQLRSFGAMVGIRDRIEFSIAEQRFDTQQVGAALGLGAGFTFKQQIVGAKVRVAGDAILDQDTWMPQISFGLQYKKTTWQYAICRIAGDWRKER